MVLLMIFLAAGTIPARGPAATSAASLPLADSAALSFPLHSSGQIMYFNRKVAGCWAQGMRLGPSLRCTAGIQWCAAPAGASAAFFKGGRE